MVAKGWRGGGIRELVVNGYRVPVLQDEKSSGGGLHNNGNVLNTTELCT